MRPFSLRLPAWLRGDEGSPLIRTYLLAIALTAFGLGLSNDIISNYFKDAYHVNAYQRGLIEFPREIPGVLCYLVIALLSRLGDIRLALVAQVLSLGGIIVLGLVTPPFAIMLVFVFINSLGMHLFMPLSDSIGLGLIQNSREIGRWMGRFKGTTTAFQMAGAILVFIGFRLGFFSFDTPIKGSFLLAGILFSLVFMLLIKLGRITRDQIPSRRNRAFILRRQYRFYYALVILFGAQKQIMMVYGPWVLIDLLGKKADTIAILSMAGGLAGTFFIPALGRWLDRWGIRAMLFVDALSFIGVYLLYGVLASGLATGFLPPHGLAVVGVYLIFIMDRMSTQMGLVRTVYLRSIALSPAEITPTLSLGLSLDHIVSIICAFLGGLVWMSWGPQYIFFLAAFLSLGNLYVAFKVRLPV